MHFDFNTQISSYRHLAKTTKTLKTINAETLYTFVIISVLFVTTKLLCDNSGIKSLSLKIVLKIRSDHKISTLYFINYFEILYLWLYISKVFKYLCECILNAFSNSDFLSYWPLFRLFSSWMSLPFKRFFPRQKKITKGICSCFFLYNIKCIFSFSSRFPSNSIYVELDLEFSCKCIQ